MADTDLPLEFQFDFRTLRGRGGPICLPRHAYPNIIRLRLDGESLQGLPQNIILKKKDDSYKSFFETERKIYENAEELQERGFIPQYHGLASIDGSPAMILSDLGGTMLLDQPSLSLHENALREKLRELLEAIRRAGVVHNDVTLLNVLHCDDGRLRLIDFELADMDQPVDQAGLKDEVEMQVDDLVGSLKLRQNALEEQELRNKRDAPIHRWNSVRQVGVDYGSALCQVAAKDGCK